MVTMVLNRNHKIAPFVTLYPLYSVTNAPVATSNSYEDAFKRQYTTVKPVLSGHSK